LIRKREEKEKKFKRLTSASGSAGSLADAGLAVGGEGMPFHGVPLRDGIVQEVKAPHGERGPSHVLPHHPVLRGLREPLALKPRGQSLGVKTFNIYVAAYQILEKKESERKHEGDNTICVGQNNGFLRGSGITASRGNTAG